MDELDWVKDLRLTMEIKRCRVTKKIDDIVDDWPLVGTYDAELECDYPGERPCFHTFKTYNIQPDPNPRWCIRQLHRQVQEHILECHKDVLNGDVR